MGIKKALITGASRGIGMQLAHVLKEQGIELLLVARNCEQIEKVAHTKAISADLTTDEGIQRVCSLISDELPDLVVNNAGVGFYGRSIDKNDTEEIRLNVEALVTISKYFAKTCIEHKRPGTILNISSVLAYFISPHASVYAASKWFVNCFSQSLDLEVQKYNVRVLCACPGQVATDFVSYASHGKTRHTHARGIILDPRQVAKSMWQQVQKKKRVQIIDYRYRLLVFFSRFLPKILVAKFLSKLFQKRVQSSPM